MAVYFAMILWSLVAVDPTDEWLWGNDETIGFLLAVFAGWVVLAGWWFTERCHSR
jgi:hypothetical protein